jgi:hypothetical protein
MRLQRMKALKMESMGDLQLLVPSNLVAQIAQNASQPLKVALFQESLPT